jgi:NADH-quinone oxidoreductase subunit N
MSVNEIQALIPLMILAGAGVVLVMLSAFLPRAGTLAALAAASVTAFLVSLVPYLGGEPIRVAGLIRVDGLSLFFWALLGLSTLVSLIYFMITPVADRDSGSERYGLMVLASSGAMALASATHFAVLFLGLEILSLSLMILVAWKYQRPRAIEAGLKYLVPSGLATGFLLFGMALIYAASGSLGFEPTGGAQAGGVTDLYWLAGMALLLAGLVFKLSIVPLHLWTPDVYQGASLPVTGFLATVSKGAVLAVLVRLYRDMAVADVEGLWTGLALLAGASMLVGNWLALRQDQLKRLLAYSSIAHMGYALAALLAGGALALEAVSFYLAFYLATTLGAFGVLAVLSRPDHECERLDQLQGLYHHRPALALIMTLMMFSLAGVPLTGGFIGKFYVLAAGAQAELWTLMALVIAGSAIGLYYYLRVVLALFRAPADTADFRPATTASMTVLVLLTLIVLWLGLYPTPLSDGLARLAEMPLPR